MGTSNCYDPISISAGLFSAKTIEEIGTMAHACIYTHGTVDDLLSLIPHPAPNKARGDPFLTLSPRAAKAWLALFSHAQQHGTWRPRPVDTSRPEQTEGQQFTLTAHWTVAGLGYALGVNRDTAGKALQELVEGGWLRREDPRNKGQFGGIDFCFTTPSAVTQADKAKVVDGLKKRGMEFKSYEWRTAARVLDEQEIKRVQQDVQLEIAAEQADLAGDEDKAIDLASKSVLRQQMAGEE
jgi:hypothetical protein